MKTSHHLIRSILVMALLWCSAPEPAAYAAAGVVDSMTLNGQIDQEHADFILKGRLKGGTSEEKEPALIYSLQSVAKIQVEPKTVTQTCEIKAAVLQGKLREIILVMRGDGEVTLVTGSNLKDWSVRMGPEGKKFLVIRPIDPGTNAPAITNFIATITTKQTFGKLPITSTPLTFAPDNAAFHDGSMEVKAADSLDLSITNLSGLFPVRTDPLTTIAEQNIAPKDQPFRFHFSGADYRLTFTIQEKDPDARKVIFENFKLVGEVKGQIASFVLTGDAIVKHPDGGVIAVLSGDAALTSFPASGEVYYEQGRYWLRFRKPGKYPVELKFNAKTTTQDAWTGVSFEIVPSTLRPLTLKGLSADTQFQFTGAAKPIRQGDEYASFLPSDGRLQLQWKEAKSEELGKLFYSVQGTAQITVGPGLMRQVHLMEYKVMQGELNKLVFELSGDGEVTRIRGEDILAWKIEGPTADKKRTLTVQLNQARKDKYSVVIQTQTPLNAFPLSVQPLRLVPSQAIRYGGHLLVMNDGAVRLEVTEARGLSQISPDLFPKNKELAEFAPPQLSQTFAYRFSGGDYSLAIQADHILPELSVSEMLIYHLGETETSIDAEIELDIREAPLREFYIRVPADFTVSRVNVAQLADYSLNPETDTKWAKLKLLFSNPLTGRQVIQLRLEKNQNANPGPWELPAIQPLSVKSVRGYVGISAETGYRLTPGALVGLTEIASAFFPKKIAGLQATYRLREETWQATMNIERLALSIQADVTHLFTVSEGIAYGSSVMNYLISGTPVSMLRLEVPTEYANLEFTGKDVRNWKKVGTNYEVYLHTPVFGAYTLLATYDRQFHSQSNTLSFTGVRPLDAQSEQGSVIVVSEYQFEVKPEKISPGLLLLDPAEIPAENRLLFDAPILAAYQYTARPFALELALRSLAPGQTVHQVVDRASLSTRVSREGEVVTEARYFVKSQGYTHLRLTLPSPKDAQLWEAKVNGVKVVPVVDRQQTLIPLPGKADPSALLTIDLKLASKSPQKTRVALAAPILGVPVLLTEWHVTPDEHYQLGFLSGAAAPKSDAENLSGFGWLTNVWQGMYGSAWPGIVKTIPALLFIGLLLMFWGTREGVFRWSAQHLVGMGIGLAACLASLGCIAALGVFATNHLMSNAPGFSILAPIQEAGKALTMEVSNGESTTWGFSLWSLWPAAIGVAIWIGLFLQHNEGVSRKAGELLGWVFIFFGALRAPNGAAFFFAALFLFVLIHLLIPSLRCQWRLPQRPLPPPPAPPEITTAATALIVGSLLFAGSLCTASAASTDDVPKSTVQSVTQQARIQDGFVFIKTQIKWKAEVGQKLDFLSAPAVLTQIDYPQAALTLSESKVEGLPVSRLTAKEAGQFDISFQYQIAYQKDAAANSFVLPTPYGLMNELQLEIEKGEVDVTSPQAISVKSDRTKRGDVDVTTASLVLSPVAKAVIVWKPRGRDTRTEKAVFYAELSHLYIPTAGVIEGIHDVQVRPAQGQLSEASFQIPAGLAITDVQAEFVSNWRFDPDQHALRVQFTTPQSKPFSLRLRSQLATSPLPYQQAVSVITMQQAAGQVGMIGAATGSEVQLDDLKEEGLSAINVEDFPSALVAEVAKQIPGLTLRRAFRYSESTAKATLSASAVQPDVRVETQETLSLGEDRAVLASQLMVHITRAGIFKLSFVLPTDFEVEAISSPVLSHWTELKTAGERIITLHLKGKTEADQAFSVTLSGPGMANRKEWTAPRLTLREASKQTGQLIISPELGMRLHIKTRDGLTQLDPQKAGVQQKGVMAFRLLHSRWQLGFDIETVEPWIQLATLQDVTVREGQMLVTAQFQYQIENAGLKSLVVQLPVQAENVRFEGDLISDSLKQASGTNRLADWEVKLQRRVIGEYALRITYQITLTNQPTTVNITGIRAKNANQQRGFLAVRAGGRLQIQFPQLPQSFQRTEWQAIPANLRRGRDLTESKDTFSTMETEYLLPITLSRHEVSKVLPARVEKIDLTSVVAPSGEMLTQGRLWMRPGDKRLLRLKLPVSGEFWYAFVNGQSASPWREGAEILLLLEKNSDPAKPTIVEFFYTCQTEARGLSGFNHQLFGPSFDLPLENITWQVYVPENWQIKDWKSTLQLRSDTAVILPTSLTLDSYLQSETALQKEKSKDAENLLSMGNSFLQQGVPQQARRAFKSAWMMSAQDAAFNEDARVQLHNLKMQQALLGLNQRRVAAFDYQDKGGAGGGKQQLKQNILINSAANQAPDYTQQQAEQIFNQNGQEDNAVLMRLAERLIRQQDASVSKPEAIRAALPTQGKLLTFTGSLQVENWADLSVKLDAKVQSSGHAWSHLLLLAACFIGLGVLMAITRNPSKMAR